MRLFPKALQRPPSLGLYARLAAGNRPRSYAGKFFAVAFVTLQLPLLALLAWLLATQRIDGRGWLLPGVAMLLAGTLLAFRGFRQLAAPIDLAARALREFLHEGTPPELPQHYRDTAGRLLRDVRYVTAALARERSELEKLAQSDFLTGLMNRRAADRALHDIEGAWPRCVGMLDIDHFKSINDRYGHGVGDAVLAELGRLLRASLRESDWAARWGGEEFLLLIHAALPDAQSACERLRARVAEHRFAGELKLRISFSVGLAEVEPGNALDAAIARADEALLAAKRNGRDRVELYATAR
ncbi:diguanylate cyclase (GGDEF) domain-containing protein [Mizugakiibacter sediminis]|uniref:diguanylate cyclase n=1 Tax=Mizugakiibacter sediminis TaxID=1475481 RepID=A0A0K8QJQ5_9GAMM|nr:GGDEF domain-containing protein [Mizugakiibacter sediminis]GAP65069.1 diguanylate cyclase (GGDEF) domain-containing protein [Mizugakiibacter sediminis]